jgi:hypothetical protein
MAAEHERDPFALIPPPQVVREQLADNVVAAAALRKLLRLAEDVAQRKQNRANRVAEHERRSSQ